MLVSKPSEIQALLAQWFRLDAALHEKPQTKRKQPSKLTGSTSPVHAFVASALGMSFLSTNEKILASQYIHDELPFCFINFDRSPVHESHIHI